MAEVGFMKSISKDKPSGISLRDHFAGLAMQGMMVQVNEPDGDWIARHSYAVADAMLARRKRKPNDPETR